VRVARDIAVIAAFMALVTWLLGWWAIPVVAALAAVFDRRQRASIFKASVAAPLAWALLLLSQELLGSSVRGLDRGLAASLGVPAPVPLILTLVLPMILAASAAGTVAGLKGVRSRQ
jgi:H+/Cl- antiporter ClcA